MHSQLDHLTLDPSKERSKLLGATLAQEALEHLRTVMVAGHALLHPTQLSEYVLDEDGEVIGGGEVVGGEELVGLLEVRKDLLHSWFRAPRPDATVRDWRRFMQHIHNK